MSLSCSRGHWDFDDKLHDKIDYYSMYEDIIPTLRECLETALTCNDFSYIEYKNLNAPESTPKPKPPLSLDFPHMLVTSWEVYSSPLTHQPVLKIAINHATPKAYVLEPAALPLLKTTLRDIGVPNDYLLQSDVDLEALLHYLSDPNTVHGGKRA